ncbi:hypothetical protein [Rhizobium phaseoli]|uniref:hypothetical protein n=1 Tax=Rhizobium phaseoli TaxID=396 RepID=UPI0007EB64AA|nr:hypothetical protein [Rhizobium phaseoli]
MRDRVRHQLQVMSRGLIDNSESAGAIRQAVKMELVARRTRPDDIADVVAMWEALMERQSIMGAPRHWRDRRRALAAPPRTARAAF